VPLTVSDGESNESHARSSQAHLEPPNDPKNGHGPGACPDCAVDWKVSGLTTAGEMDEHVAGCLDRVTTGVNDVDDDGDDDSIRRGGFGLRSPRGESAVGGNAAGPSFTCNMPDGLICLQMWCQS
jgi:hypothetical protein